MAFIYSRDNAAWTKAIIVYEKVGDRWIRRSYASTILEDDTIYIPLTALGLLIDESTDRVVIGDDRILI